MSILPAIVMIALLVFIHEFGHFIVAKACGVAVPVLSIGFGRRLFGVEIGGTDYRVSLLPFGGYVRMAGADPFGHGDEDDDELEDPSQAFNRKPVWQRLAVSSAGPASNLALPFVLFTVLLMAGEPQPAPVVGSVSQHGLAAEMGFLPGDRVQQVAGAEVKTWGDMARALTALEPGTHTLVLDRQGQRIESHLQVPEGGLDRGLGLGYLRPDTTVGVDDPSSPAGRAGVETGDRILSVDGVEVSDWVSLNQALDGRTGSVELEVEGEQGLRKVEMSTRSAWSGFDAGVDSGPAADFGLLSATLFVGNVGQTLDAEEGLLSGCRPAEEQPPSPALEAGIQQGDRFLRLDGEAVTSWNDVLNGVQATMDGEGAEAKARTMSVELVRAGKRIQFQVTPRVIEDTNQLGRFYHRPVLGVTRMGGLVDGPTTRKYYSFGAALSRATDETLTLSGYIVEQIGKLLTGEAAVRQSLGGPVEMVRQATQAAEKGVFAWARLMGMLSISLGIINLLPVPVLDGGQMVFHLVEGIRGRPLSLAMRERLQQVGVLALVLLMLSVLVFDISRLFEGVP